jgi:hypothetical protein
MKRLYWAKIRPVGCNMRIRETRERQPENAAKIAAYNAYRIGREALLQGQAGDVRDQARQCLAGLQFQSPTIETLLRRMFYTLILAELYRPLDPLPYREAAFDLGARLAELGSENPFSYYMKIVEATGRVHDVNLALAGVGLPDAYLEFYANFLDMRLHEIAKKHGLAK